MAELSPVDSDDDNMVTTPSTSKPRTYGSSKKPVRVPSEAAESASSGEEAVEEPGKSVAADEEDEEGEEDDGESFEIERIMKDERGKLTPGSMAYFVRWKGYGPSEDSWIDEADANAPELIKEYELAKLRAARSSTAPKSRKSTNNNTSVRKAPSSASVANNKKRANDEMVEEPEPPAKKSRKSVAKLAMSVDEDDDVETLESTSASAAGKAKSAAATKAKAKVEVKAKGGSPVDQETEELEEISEPMDKKYHARKSWEDLVVEITTVEKDEDGTLYVYFIGKDNIKRREKGDLVGEKFPKKLIKFYEDKLRWTRVTIDEDGQPDEEEKKKA